MLQLLTIMGQMRQCHPQLLLHYVLPGGQHFMEFRRKQQAQDPGSSFQVAPQAAPTAPTPKQ
jgi:hypothetical protein